MIWRTVPVCDLYEVSERGDVRRRGKVLPLKPWQNEDGYLEVCLSDNSRCRTWCVHQLLALAFHGPRPPGTYHAAHRDGNKRRNTPSNVQWITAKQNAADKALHDAQKVHGVAR